MQVAFLAGLLYTAVGFLQLGWVTNFLSQSVIAGFMTGASVIIGLQQVGPLTGFMRRQHAALRQAQTLLRHGMCQPGMAESMPEPLHSAMPSSLELFLPALPDTPRASANPTCVSAAAARRCMG